MAKERGADAYANGHCRSHESSLDEIRIVNRHGGGKHAELLISGHFVAIKTILRRGIPPLAPRSARSPRLSGRDDVVVDDLEAPKAAPKAARLPTTAVGGATCAFGLKLW